MPNKKTNSSGKVPTLFVSPDESTVKFKITINDFDDNKTKTENAIKYDEATFQVEESTK